MKPVHLRRDRGAYCGEPHPARLAKFPAKVTCQDCLLALGCELLVGAHPRQLKHVGSGSVPRRL